MNERFQCKNEYTKKYSYRDCWEDIYNKAHINKYISMSTIFAGPINIWVIPCEITQKSAILTPTPFDFGENWWTYSTPWPKHVRTILALGDLSGQI